VNYFRYGIMIGNNVTPPLFNSLISKTQKSKSNVNFDPDGKMNVVYDPSKFTKTLICMTDQV
jgi:hypothetical protein